MFGKRVSCKGLGWLCVGYSSWCGHNLNRNCNCNCNCNCNFNQALDGLETIRAYRSAAHFQAENCERIRRNARPQFLQWAANKWLGVRLQVLAGQCF